MNQESKQSLKEFALGLKSAKNVIVMTGAGVSTNANIPDFRSESSGLYNKLEKYNLPHPTAVFTLDYFKHDPRPFYEIIHELYPNVVNAQPTITHYFIKLLNDKNMLLRHYTQNVDGLEDLTGLSQDKTVQAHGHIRNGTCLNCGYKCSFDYMKKFIAENKIPECSKCSQTIKPDVVLFGEDLPANFKNSTIDFSKCDLLLVMGTSLAVQPFASLVNAVKPNTTKLLINKTIVEIQNLMFCEADCDQGCLELSRLLGWDQELNELFQKNF